ncbi:MAG: hypothetical protein ACLTYN_11665 [Dysosmobacter welbionis]
MSDPNISVGITRSTTISSDPTESCATTCSITPHQRHRLRSQLLHRLRREIPFTSANHTLKSRPPIPFHLLRGVGVWPQITETWDNGGTLSSAAMSDRYEPSSSPAGSVTAPSWPPGRWWLGT